MLTVWDGIRFSLLWDFLYWFLNFGTAEVNLSQTYCTALYMRDISAILKGTCQNSSNKLCLSITSRLVFNTGALQCRAAPVLFSGILESPNNPLINVDDNVLIASNMAHWISMQMPFEQNKDIDYEVSFFGTSSPLGVINRPVPLISLCLDLC